MFTDGVWMSGRTPRTRRGVWGPAAPQNNAEGLGERQPHSGGVFCLACFTELHSGGKLNYSILVFVEFGRFLAEPSPRTNPNGSGLKNGVERT
jgi:hypothetical protein